MDQKEIKSVLKTAKESLDQKDYKTALKQCKAVLKVDRNNYMALVFYGAAVQQTELKDEAPKAFRKAIEVSPERLLAWRGLASFYEKSEGNNSNLIEVYLRLLDLETDESKIPEIIEKLGELFMCENDPVHFNKIENGVTQCNDQRKLMLQECLINLVSKNENLSHNSIAKELLNKLVSVEQKFENNEFTSKLYLNKLYEDENFQQLFEEANKFVENHPENVSTLEWICKIFTELPENELKKLANNFPVKVFNAIIEKNPGNYLGHFSKGIHEFYSCDYLSANESFKEASRLEPNSGPVRLKLCLSQIMLFRFSEAEESSLKAINLFKKNSEKVSFCKLKLLECLSEEMSESKLSEGEKLGEELLENDPENLEILQYIIIIEAKLGKFSQAEEKLKHFTDDMFKFKYLKCVILREEKNLIELKKNLEETVKDFPDDHWAWLELGKIYYNEKNPTLCLNHLLKSAKLNQWCCWSFLFLGHCYRNLMQDLEKARRCYQKAFQLNPSNSEAGVSLSDVYRILGKEDLNHQFLTAITTLNPRSKWAWLKLGLYYLSVNNHQSAVNSLRTAVRLDADNENAWECLGDAYYAQAAYTSALKSYVRVRELNPRCFYSQIQIAGIKHIIGSYRESVEEFRLIIDQIPDYIPALKGHSEACLSLMKEYLSQNLNGLAHDSCQEAVTSLVKCLQQQKDLICIWKLLGNACALLASLPEKYCKLELDSPLFSNNQTLTGDKVILTKSQIMKLGSRSYCQAIALNPNISSLWYDLAFIYYQMVKESKEKETRKTFTELSCSAVKKSILLNNNSWESWNLYGILFASPEIQNYQLTQHCFIKAILKQETNPVTWTNLGVLYLDLNDLQIANLSFTEAQRCDHDYVFCWVGQAIIAQRIGHHDAMDLYRHSTQLGFSTEGCLGYSNFVCQTILNTKNKNDSNYLYSIKNMNAVAVAIKTLTWFTDRFSNNPWAFNMLGLLLEHQMLYKSAAEAFFQALQLKESEQDGNDKKDEYLDIIDRILLNHSRVLSRLEKNQEALTYLVKINKASFTNHCELAAAYFRVGEYEKAYSSYETTLEWLASDTKLKSHILVAMAAVVYLHQGQEDAKILLMQSCQLKPPSVEGLFALCALGMLHSDLALSELAVNELKQYKDSPEYLGHIAVFEAYTQLFKGEKKGAIRALCKAIHRHPNESSLWHSLSLLLLHLYPSFDSKCAARCAEVSLITGRLSIDVSQVMSFVSLSNLLANEGLKSLKSAQKAVHIFPDVTENWIVLLASVLSKCLIQQSPEEIRWLKKIISHVSGKFQSSHPMRKWLCNNNRKISALAENLGYGVPDIEIEASYFNLEYFNT